MSRKEYEGVVVGGEGGGEGGGGGGEERDQRPDVHARAFEEPD